MDVSSTDERFQIIPNVGTREWYDVSRWFFYVFETVWAESITLRYQKQFCCLQVCGDICSLGRKGWTRFVSLVRPKLNKSSYMKRFLISSRPLSMWQCELKMEQARDFAHIVSYCCSISKFRAIPWIWHSLAVQGFCIWSMAKVSILHILSWGTTEPLAPKNERWDTFNSLWLKLETQNAVHTWDRKRDFERFEWNSGCRSMVSVLIISYKKHYSEMEKIVVGKIRLNGSNSA